MKTELEAVTPMGEQGDKQVDTMTAVCARFERIIAGYRCRYCHTWVQIGSELKCLCDKPTARPERPPQPAPNHLPLLIEAAKGILNIYTWRKKKNYQSALKQGVMELEAALKPFLDGPQGS